MVHRVLDPWMGLYRLQLDFRIQISFQNEKKKERKDVEMHFKCDFSPLRIQTVTLPHPLSIKEEKKGGVVVEGE